jgi:hypothetical protein
MNESSDGGGYSGGYVPPAPITQSQAPSTNTGTSSSSSSSNATSGTPNDTSAQVNSWLSKYFPQGATTGTGSETQLAQDEASAQLARQAGGGNPYGGTVGGWDGFKLPAHVSPDSFMTALNAAETWAATVGWRYFPTAANVMSLISQGPMTSQQYAAYFSGSMPAAAKASMPWATTGVSPQSYADSLQNYSTAAYSMLGKDYTQSGLDQSIMQQAVAGNWSISRFTQEIQNDPAAQSQYGWIKHGMTYADFNKYLTDNKTSLEKRYGSGNATSSNALSDLNNPLQGFGSYAPPITTAGSQLGGQNAGSLDQQYGSSVR